MGTNFSLWCYHDIILMVMMHLHFLFWLTLCLLALGFVSTMVIQMYLIESSTLPGVALARLLVASISARTSLPVTSSNHPFAQMYIPLNVIFTYAGFNSTLRRGNVTHHEYIQVGKGRDVGLNQISLFEAKVACGNGEQTLSRDVYRLGHRFDFFRMLSFYFTTVGFYVSAMVIFIRSITLAEK